MLISLLQIFGSIFLNIPIIFFKTLSNESAIFWKFCLIHFNYKETQNISFSKLEKAFNWDQASFFANYVKSLLN